jgi:hypothetical protein
VNPPILPGLRLPFSLAVLLEVFRCRFAAPSFATYQAVMDMNVQNQEYSASACLICLPLVESNGWRDSLLAATSTTLASSRFYGLEMKNFQ